MKKKITAIASLFAFVAIILWIALPNSVAEEEHGHAEEQSEETGAGESLAITNAQMEAAGIKLHEVKLGGTAEIIVPATVEATTSGNARLDARAEGTIRSIRKTLGDSVAKGETVALIESSQAAQYSADIASARARLSQAQATSEREKRLFEARVTARQDLEAAQAQLSIARADLSRAQSTARAAGVTGSGNMIAVTSPISGKVTNAPAVLGSFVTAGTELMSIVNPALVQIEAALPAKDATRIGVGDSATIRLSDGEEITARVRSITPSLNPESRSATAILVPSRIVASLQPDAFVEVRISVGGESDPNIISIPEEAVQTIDGKQIVFVREGQTFKPVEVSVGARSAGNITILSGLESGALIASVNAFLLKADLEKSEAEHGH